MTPKQKLKEEFRKACDEEELGYSHPYEIADWFLCRTVPREAVDKVVEDRFEKQAVHIAQSILSAMESRGFYDLGKCLDHTIIKTIKHHFTNLLQDK